MTEKGFAVFAEYMDKYMQSHQQTPVLGELSVVIAFSIGTLILVSGGVFLVIKMRKMSQKEDSEAKPSSDNESVTHVQIATQIEGLEDRFDTRFTGLETHLGQRLNDMADRFKGLEGQIAALIARESK